MLWRIRWEDLQFESPNKYHKRGGSRLTLSQVRSQVEPLHKTSTKAHRWWETINVLSEMWELNTHLTLELAASGFWPFFLLSGPALSLNYSYSSGGLCSWICQIEKTQHRSTDFLHIRLIPATPEPPREETADLAQIQLQFPGTLGSVY